MVTFLLLTTLEGVGDKSLYLWLYGLKVVIVTTLLLFFSQPRQDIRWSRRVLLPAITIGLAVFALWIALEQWFPYPHLGERVGFNPFAELGGWYLPVFLTLRVYGLVLMVPVMEELFWRSFLLRYFTDPDFQKVPMGAFSGPAFGIVAIAFGLSHSEWLVAILCACAYALLLKVTRSLYACVVAHITTNLALGCYIIWAQAWTYW